ncbi:peptide-methionine (R)-S-oxide reductase MsrB [Ferruginibacter yonginensis]|uniref:peptide-methionine (R)-S-oxide reductase n=1 Tax=Ferruginibacter yonginensis TaxID=1310416 RepID=A0ABV8QT03_9BACT
MKSFKNYAMSMIGLLIIGASCTAQQQKATTSKEGKEVAEKTSFPKGKTNAEWKKILTSTQYEIMVNRGTERPFDNPYYNNHEKGFYLSAATGDTLFSSDAKFESGTGWPSFFTPYDKNKVTVVKDNSYGMERDEIIETSTGLHLGHVFNDGPKPTGLRYCMNSAAFKFVKAP